MNRFPASLLVALAASIAVSPAVSAQADQRTPRGYDLLHLLHTNSWVSPYAFVRARGPLLVEARQGNEPHSGDFEVRNWSLDFPEQGALTIDPELLADVLATCLPAFSGREDDDLSLRISGGRLHGKLTEPEHQAVLYLLDHLRLATETLVEVECVLVTPETWAELTKATKFELGTRNAVLEQALLDPRSRLLAAVGRNGQWNSSGPLTRHRVHDDFEVNQTGVIPVNNPVVNDRWSGERLEVVPLILRRSGKVFLDLAIGGYAVRPQRMSLLGPWGELDSPVQEERLLSTSLIVRPGQAVLAGELDAPGGLVALVRVNTAPAAEPRSPPRVGDRVLRIHETAPLFRIHRRSLEDPDDRPPMGNDALMNRLGARFGDDLQGVSSLRQLGDDLAVVATEEVHQAISTMIDEELTELSRNATIELEVLSVPRGLYAALRRHLEGVSLLRDGWADALRDQPGVERQRYSVAGAAGQIHGIRNVRWEPLMVDVAQVSGGTGFAIIEVADPILADGGSGIQLRVEALLAGDGEHAHLRFEGEQAQLVEKRAVTSVYPVLTAVTEQGSESAPAVRGQEVKLSLPQQESIRWDILRTLPLGRWSVLYRDAKAGEAVRLVVGRVTRGGE